MKKSSRESRWKKNLNIFFFLFLFSRYKRSHFFRSKTNRILPLTNYISCLCLYEFVTFITRCCCSALRHRFTFKQLLFFFFFFFSIFISLWLCSPHPNSRFAPPLVLFQWKSMCRLTSYWHYIHHFKRWLTDWLTWRGMFDVKCGEILVEGRSVSV